MNILVKIIVVLMVLVAVLFLSKPDIARRMMQFLKQGKRFYIAAVLRLVLAIIFLLAAGQCRHPRIVGVFGVIFLLSGLLAFIIPAEKIKAVLDWFLRQQLLIFRIVAVLILIISAILLYAV